ncbi:tricarballylate utilization 4Fe-4S protein TcuB [Mesorhizobium xinjiangense]|uniref:tricarballylate utilization 4Fe-4S protein TcuB n=1 Tax=Mesorhizobium xinjiangense TaxID=2678685 RepID=UPI0012EEC7CD|nr:tricarballylate utilization 4Fe-4S protein TcuB [Mesorhizobium xinjiangense]
MHTTKALAEANRLMTVCNSCRYCEGLCAVFPAMEMRRSFADGDLNYLANLCHSCGGCYIDCQFTAPHEFDVNVPRTLAIVRSESYAAHVWPQAMSGVFRRNGLVISLLTAATISAFFIGMMLVHSSGGMFRAYADADGSFYALMPHNVMAGVFTAVSAVAALAMVLSIRNFWRAAGTSLPIAMAPADIWQAIRDAATMRYLEGGGQGCYEDEAVGTDNRRFYHHLTFYGFMLCFASTSVATSYHYLLGMEAPYPWYDLPVVLGTIGGIGLLIGPVGLLLAKKKRDPMVQDDSFRGMEVGFIVMLFLTSLTGLALMLMRETAAMGVLLALHLGIVAALFLTMPYGKFMHGLYRFTALVRYSAERRLHM